MIKLIIFHLLSSIINCYAQPPDLIFSNRNSHHLAFHQPDLGIHHQLNFHQPPNHQFQNSQPQLTSRLSNQNIPRANRLLPSGSSPKSTVFNRNSQNSKKNQFNNQNNFKPANRVSQLRSQSGNQKRQKQSNQQKNHHIQPKINWGRCHQLKPSNEEKVKKAQVISKCLEITPVPDNITRVEVEKFFSIVELHRELVAACALKEEGWFTSALSSDETNSKINVNNNTNLNDINSTNLLNKMFVTTNLTASSIDVHSNDTLKDSSKDNNQQKENLKHNINTTLRNEINSTVASSESLWKPIQLNLAPNKTKLEQSNNDKSNSTILMDRIDRSDNDNQATILHGSLESDDYAEEDLTGYSAIFTGQLQYNYAKAEREIRAKKFDSDVEQKVLIYHHTCREEAQEKYNNPIQVIGQIQLYQACMDWHISSVCGIEITY